MPPLRAFGPPDDDPLTKLARLHGILPSAGASVSGTEDDDTPDNPLEALARSKGVDPATLRPPLRAPLAPIPSVAADAARVRPQGPNDPRYAPSLLERAIPAVAAGAEDMVRHPIKTAASLVTAPLESAAKAFNTPVEGERVSAARENRGKAGRLPGALPAGSTITKENTPGAISEREFLAAGAQTIANAALPGIAGAVEKGMARVGASKLAGATAGAGVAGATVGATYSPDDPALGAVAGFLLGAPFPAAIEGVGHLAGAARPRVAAVVDSWRQAREAVAQGAEPGAAQQVLTRALAQLDPADLRYAANDPTFGPIFRQALQARGFDMPPEPVGLRGLLSRINDTPDAPSIELVGPRSREQAQTMERTGFAEKPDAGVELPAGESGRIGTVEAVKRAKALVGPEEFAARVREELTRRGGDDPLSQAAAVEETARRIVAESGPKPEGATPLEALAQEHGVGVEEPPVRPAGGANDAPAGAEAPPTPQRPRAPREAMIVEDGEKRHVNARTANGTRRPVEKVSTEGLIREFLDLTGKQQDALRRSQYNFVETQQSNLNGDITTVVPLATRTGGGPSKQAKALRNLGDFERIRGEVEATLRARGISDEELAARIEALHEQRIEREGMEGRNLARAVGQEPYNVTNEAGDVLFAPAGGDVERVTAPAIRTRDGRVFQGPLHILAVEEAKRAGAFGEKAPGVAGYDSGFVTSSGRFVSRKEATRIAERAEQPEVNYRAAQRGENAGELDALDVRGRERFDPGELGDVQLAPAARGRGTRADEGPDLFGNEPEGPRAVQGSLLDDRAGTAESRPLRAAEQAARAEIAQLRQVAERSTDPAQVQRAAARIAELEKLVNRGEKITPDELANRAKADTPLEQLAQRTTEKRAAAEQDVLLSPMSNPTSSVGRRMRALVAKQRPGVTDDVANLRSISLGLADALGVPTYQGRGNLKRMGALGAFWIKPEVVRVRRIGNVATVAHEHGHFLDKKFGIRAIVKAEPDPAIRRTAAAELVQMGKNLYGNRKPRGGYGSEGIAEWFKFYVSDPQRLAAEAPTASPIIARLLDGEPTIKAAWEKARADFERFTQAPAEAKLQAMITSKLPQRFTLNPRRAVQAIFDDLEPVQHAVETLGKPGRVLDDAYTLARLTKGNGGRARDILERGVTDFTTRKRLTRGLPEILESIGERDLDPFTRYWVAEQVLTKHGQGINTGFDVPAARETVNAGRQNPKYVQAAKELWDFRSKLLQYATDAGLMTPDELQAIRANNPTPTPFYRHFEKGEGGGMKGSSKGLAQLGAGVNRLKGSDRPIVNPLESLVADTYRLVDVAQRHHAAEVLLKQALETEGGGVIASLLPEKPMEARRIGMERVTEQLVDAGWTPPEPGSNALPLEELVAFYEKARAGAAENRDMVLPVLIDGERRWVQIHDKPLWDALQGMGVQELGMLERVLSAPTRLLRMGATQLNPDFVLVNPFRDAVQAAIYSRGPTRPPGYHIARGIFHLLREKFGSPDEIAERWAQEGGEAASMVSADRRLIQQAYRRTVADLTAHGLGRAKLAATHPLRQAQAFFELLEQGTRVGEFALQRETAMKRGVPEVEASARAALDSRDVTLDFFKAGTVTRPANRYIAFLTAHFNDIAKMGAELDPRNLATAQGAKRMGTVAARAAAFITLPSIALYLMQRDDPVYQEVPEYWKASSWVIVDNDAGPLAYTTPSGKRIRVWVFPRPHLLGYLFGYMPEKMLEWAGDRDPAALSDLAKNTWSALVPNSLWLPTLAVPLIENYANRKLFNDAPVVPDRTLQRPAAEQANRSTGELARTIGAAVDYSPGKIENVVRGYTGGLGLSLKDLADYGLRKGKEAAGAPILTPPPVPGSDPLDQIPVVRRFVVPPPGAGAKSVQQVRDAFEKAEQHRQAWQTMKKQGQTALAQLYFNTHADEIRSVFTKTEGGGSPGDLRRAWEALNASSRSSRSIMEQLEDMADTTAQRRIQDNDRAQVRTARQLLGKRP